MVPVELIDGIDSHVSFRLAEREIADIQNLATENPILLSAETPYPLLEVLDWIAQAQLALEVGPKKYRQLRDLGVRTINALEVTATDPQLRAAILLILYEQESERPETLTARIAAMRAGLHVARLEQVRAVVHKALQAEVHTAAGPGSGPGDTAPDVDEAGMQPPDQAAPVPIRPSPAPYPRPA